MSPSQQPQQSNSPSPDSPIIEDVTGREWVEKLPLPNGLTFYVTSAPLRGQAKFLIYEIFRRRTYWHTGFDLRPDDTVVDVGGNIGMFTAWAALQVPRGRVVTIEPTPSAFKSLKLNVELNDLRNVTPIQAAIGKDGGEMEMLLRPGWEIFSFNSELPENLIRRMLVGIKRPGAANSEPVRVVVPTISLGRVMDHFELASVNFLKVDCEGCEFAMIKSLSASHWKRIERVAMEFHELSKAHRHEELVAILRNNGFEVAVQRSWLERSILKIGRMWAWRPRSEGHA